MKFSQRLFLAYALLSACALLMAEPARAADTGEANATGGGTPALAQPTPVLAQPSMPAWPDKVLPSVNYEDVPLSEVAKSMQDAFKGDFDLVLPNNVQATGDSMIATNWMATPVTLQLKNVNAQELLAAMNMYFDVISIPLRWESHANGSRPVAILTVLEGATVAKSEPSRNVFFVGDLIGSAKAPGMTMDQVVQTVDELYQMSFNKSPEKVIQASKETQLIVVTGTTAELSFVNNTLLALTEKVTLQRKEAEPAATPATPPGAAK